MKIPFNKPISIDSFSCVKDFASRIEFYGGNGPHSRRIEVWFKEYLKMSTFLTSSCTQAMELACILFDISEGDEVIMPAFNFTSAPAVVSMFGAKPVFVDISEQDLNIDCSKIESAISEKTKGIFAMNYAGVPCDYDKLSNIAQKNSLFILEDNAHGLGGRLDEQPLGTFGDVSCHSFHYSKNVHCGEGGALSIKDRNNELRAEIVREKGTNRAQYLRGQKDKYSWHDKGGSFLLSDILSAVLDSQLASLDSITQNRLRTWHFYYESLVEWCVEHNFAVPIIKRGLLQPAHIFYLWSRNSDMSLRLIDHLRKRGVDAVQHYQSLDQSVGFQKYGKKTGESCDVSRMVSQGIVRLPLWYDMTDEERGYVVDGVLSFKY